MRKVKRTMARRTRRTRARRTRKTRGGGCGCGLNVPKLRALFESPYKAGGGALPELAGTCNGACNLSPQMAAQLGGGARICRGSGRQSPRIAATLKRYAAGKSIGFTATSSLKARGLIPRTSAKNRGKCVVSNKYK